MESTGLLFRRGLVAGHPEVQARVAAELESLGLLATPGNPIPRRLEYADLAKLPYMDAVLRESLRLLPVSAAGLAAHHAARQACHRHRRLCCAGQHRSLGTCFGSVYLV